MAYIGITRRFRLKSHTHIEDLDLNLDHPEKLITWGFKDFSREAPHPYGCAGGLLWPARNKDEKENQRMKHMFLYNVENCWVRSVTEYPNKIEITLW